MKLLKSLFLMVLVGLVVAAVFLHAPRAFGAGFTAKALVEVLPYADKDPFALETPPIDEELQYQFRLSMATLMTTQGVYENLLRRDVVRKTMWYREKAAKLPSGVADLRKNLRAVAMKQGNFIEVSMTCDDAREAADIANEMVKMFIDMQTNRAEGQVASKLAKLQERKSRIEEDLRTAEKALDDVRAAWSLTDLDIHEYPHPMTVRLIRLEELKDALALEIKGIEVAIEYQNKAGKDADPNKIRANREELFILKGKYIEAERLRQEAQLKHKDLDMARSQYAKRVKIRDERIRMLDEVKRLIEKLKILYADPDTAKVRKASDAARPLARDS